MRRIEPLWVLLGYGVASFLLIGRFWARAPQDAVVGSYGADQGFFAWSLVHWVEVLAGSQAPFLTDRIDAMLTAIDEMPSDVEADRIRMYIQFQLGAQ